MNASMRWPNVGRTGSPPNSICPEAGWLKLESTFAVDTGGSCTRSCSGEVSSRPRSRFSTESADGRYAKAGFEPVPPPCSRGVDADVRIIAVILPSRRGSEAGLQPLLTDAMRIDRLILGGGSPDCKRWALSTGMSRLRRERTTACPHRTGGDAPHPRRHATSPRLGNLGTILRE